MRSIDPLGPRLKAWRRHRELTQPELSARTAGAVSQSAISAIETGTYDGTTVTTAKALAEALGITLDELVGGQPIEEVA